MPSEATIRAIAEEVIDYINAEAQYELRAPFTSDRVAAIISKHLSASVPQPNAEFYQALEAIRQERDQYGFDAAVKKMSELMGAASAPRALGRLERQGKPPG